MRTNLPTVALLIACMLSGCAEKEPLARPGAMRPRPRAIATTMPTTARAGHESKGHVVAAGMVQVYDRFVTIEDVLKAGRAAFESLGGTPGEDKKAFRKRAAGVVAEQVERVIQGTIALSAAERELTEDQEAIVQANIDLTKAEWITKSGGSIERLKRDLAADGRDLEDVLEDHRRQLTIMVYHRNKFLPSIVITQKMMWEYYRSHLEKYEITRAVRLRVIAVPARALIKPDVTKPTDVEISAAKSEARKMVRNAAKTIADGEESFDAVARRIGKAIQDRYGEKWDDADFPGWSGVNRMINDGGLWRQMSPEGFKDDVLARAAAELEQGQVGAVEETDSCCYLIKGDQVRKARNVTFEKAQEEIERELRRQEYSRRRSEHMSKIRREFDKLMGPEDPRRVRFRQVVLDHVVATYHNKPAKPAVPRPGAKPNNAKAPGGQ